VVLMVAVERKKNGGSRARNGGDWGAAWPVVLLSFSVFSFCSFLFWFSFFASAVPWLLFPFLLSLCPSLFFSMFSGGGGAAGGFQMVRWRRWWQTTTEDSDFSSSFACFLFPPFTPLRFLFLLPFVHPQLPSVFLFFFLCFLFSLFCFSPPLVVKQGPSKSFCLFFFQLKSVRSFTQNFSTP